MFVLPQALAESSDHEPCCECGGNESSGPAASEVLELVQHPLWTVLVEVRGEGSTPGGQHPDQFAGRRIGPLTGHRVKLLGECPDPVHHLAMHVVDLVTRAVPQ